MSVITSAPSHNNGNGKISASIEVSPKHALEMDDLQELIPAGTRVYITDVGTHGPAAMAQACMRLTKIGLTPVPHIPARRLEGYADLQKRIESYADMAVNDVLVVAGGVERRDAPISSTMEVLETGLLDKHGIKNIGVAGHPEGSPDFSEEVAYAALGLKKQFSERTDARMRIVTQFGFDAQKFIEWAENLGSHGIDLPVHLGVAGPANINTLIKFASMCGIGNSISFLKKRASVLTTLATGNSPEGVVGPIEAHVLNAHKTNIRAIHAFPFGGLKKTATWLAERGSWEMQRQKFQVANQA